MASLVLAHDPYLEGGSAPAWPAPGTSRAAVDCPAATCAATPLRHCSSATIPCPCPHGVAAPRIHSQGWGEMVDVGPFNTACRGTIPIGQRAEPRDIPRGCTPHQEPKGMMMGMGMETDSHRVGEQEPIPEMAPGWKDGLCVAAPAPWHWYPAPAQTLSTSSCDPTAVPVPAKPQ